MLPCGVVGGGSKEGIRLYGRCDGHGEQLSNDRSVIWFDEVS